MFFAGGIPDGTYHVLAKSADGAQQASAVFQVQVPPGGPPPPRPSGGPPPTGNVPPPS